MGIQPLSKYSELKKKKTKKRKVTWSQASTD